MIKTIIHLIFQSYKVRKEIRKFAQNIHGKNILEIGSGNNSSGKYFDNTNKFTESDINEIDATKMQFKEEYDIIICVNVLDDIFEYQKAVDNIHNALKQKGYAFVVVPVFYPLHDIPNDYFRFTEFSLKKIFSKFSRVIIESIGIKRFPSYCIVNAVK